MVWGIIFLVLLGLLILTAIANIIVKKIVKKREQKGDKQFGLNQRNLYRFRRYYDWRCWCHQQCFHWCCFLMVHCPKWQQYYWLPYLIRCAFLNRVRIRYCLARYSLYWQHDCLTYCTSINGVPYSVKIKSGCGSRAPFLLPIRKTQRRWLTSGQHYSYTLYLQRSCFSRVPIAEIEKSLKFPQREQRQKDICIFFQCN